MILGKSDILREIKEKRLIIEPFSRLSVECNGIDLRLGKQIVRFERNIGIFDTHNSNVEEYYNFREESPFFMISPHEHVLACTYERILLPDDLIGLVNLRSTYTRLGLFAPCGIVEAGFNGQLTLEIIGGHFSVRVHAKDRIFHMIVMALKGDHKAVYRGKYQNQKGVTLPILDP